MNGGTLMSRTLRRVRVGNENMIRRKSNDYSGKCLQILHSGSQRAG